MRKLATVFLYASVKAALKEKIHAGVYGAGELLPSEKELSAQFDVSLITVRRALEELREEGYVKKIKGKGTIVNEFIRLAGGNKTNKLAVLDVMFESQTESHYPPAPFGAAYNANNWKTTIYNSIFEAVRERYNLFVCSYTKQELLRQYETTILSGIDIIFIINFYDKEIIDFLHEKKKLVVVYNNFDKTMKVCSVNSNERQQCSALVEAFIREGHRQIAAIHGDPAFSESIERSMGYQEAMFKNGLMPEPGFVKWGNMTAESGYFLTKQILDGGRKPTALICVNDNVAAGAITALNEYGLSCPDDVLVAGHDNNAFIAETLGFRMITIDPHFQEIGRRIAAQMTREIWLDDTVEVGCDIVWNHYGEHASKKIG